MADFSLPPENQGAWLPGTDVGVDGGIDQYRVGGANQRTNLLNVVTTYGADNTGATSAKTAIQNAINAAASGDVVYLPAGTYKIDGSLSIPHTKDNITIRGDGDSTIVYGTTASGGVFSVVGSNSAYGSNAQTITGTKTKGTTVLAVSDSSAYSAGELATVLVENEEDNTRIQAGSAPTWTQYGYTRNRSCLVLVKAVSAGQITVFPGLPWDATAVGARIERNTTSRGEKIGFEDFAFDFDEASHPLCGIAMSLALNCWVYNVNIPATHPWQKTNSNGSMVILNNSHKVEVRHCTGIASPVVLANDFTVTSLTRSGTTGTITTAEPIDFPSLSVVNIRGAVPAAYNGDRTATVTGSNTFTFSISGSPATPATGTIRVNDGPKTSSDGFIQMSYSSSCLYIDNITKNFDVGYYNSGKTVNNAYLYNFILTEQTGSQSGFNAGHAAHTSLDLYEGNIGNNFGTDGYHASNSHHTVFRNWFHGTNEGKVLQGYRVALRRFTREMVLAGNVFGWDGTNDGAPISFGNPNLGNGASTGTAEPTTGDFWADWKLTGTLTTRTSDTAGVVTASGGAWGTTTGGAAIAVSLWWGGRTSGRTSMVINSVVGNVLTVSSGVLTQGSILPAEGTVFDLVQPTTAGFQEQDLDVENSTTLASNYYSLASGTGSLSDSIAPDTLPNSLAYTSKPAFFGSLAWPAINPDSPSFSYEAIPAGYRYVNGVDAASNVVSTPSLTPGEGEYEGNQVVSISSATSGATIRYTLDGTTPSSSNGIIYSIPIGIAETTTIKAIAYKTGLGDSAIRTGVYTITPPEEPGGGEATVAGLTANVFILGG